MNTAFFFTKHDYVMIMQRNWHGSINSLLTRNALIESILNRSWSIRISTTCVMSVWRTGQAGKIKIFGTRPNWVVSYIAYTNSTRPVLFSTRPTKFSLALASRRALVSQPAGINCWHIFMFPLNDWARKGLMALWSIKIKSATVAGSVTDGRVQVTGPIFVLYKGGNK